MSQKKAARLPCGRPQQDLRSHSVEEIDEVEMRNRLETFQVENDLRNSEARNRIIDIILSQAGHFTATELVKEVQAAHPSIGAATVYRSLPLLMEAGILRESLNDPAGQMIYEVDNTEHHDHIVCLDCNAILEFHEERIEALQEETLSERGFKPVRHKHVIYARCTFRKP